MPLQVGAGFGAGDGNVAERGEQDCRLRYGPTRLLERRHQDCLKLNQELSPVAAVHVCEHAGVSGGAEGRLRAEGGRTLLVGVPAAELEDLRLQQGDRCPSPWQLALKLKEDVFDNRLSATHAEAQEASGRRRLEGGGRRTMRQCSGSGARLEFLTPWRSRVSSLPSAPAERRFTAQGAGPKTCESLPPILT